MTLNKLCEGATYKAIDGKTIDGDQVYIFDEPCEFMCDRHSVSLDGVQFTFHLRDEIVIAQNSYELLKPRVGEWHWENWIFDGGEKIYLNGWDIEPAKEAKK
jgi:hypothetical protein